MNKMNRTPLLLRFSELEVQMSDGNEPLEIVILTLIDSIPKVIGSQMVFNRIGKSYPIFATDVREVRITLKEFGNILCDWDIDTNTGWLVLTTHQLDISKRADHVWICAIPFASMANEYKTSRWAEQFRALSPSKESTEIEKLKNAHNHECHLKILEIDKLMKENEMWKKKYESMEISFNNAMRIIDMMIRE